VFRQMNDQLVFHRRDLALAALTLGAATVLKPGSGAAQGAATRADSGHMEA